MMLILPMHTVQELLMERYGNNDGDSGVRAYEIGLDFIRINFSSGSVYLYTYESAGKDNIEQMKLLAQRGDGLNTFINTKVRNLYAQKER